MGQRITTIFQRNEEGVQEVDIGNGNAYKWPPKSGNYFGSHFIMGGERFESQQPESFLFGENNDLNFLGSRPVPFPYAQPQLNEPTRTLRSLVNIRKDTIRLIKSDLPSKDVIDTGAGGDVNNLEKTTSPPPTTVTAPSPMPPVDGDVEAGVDQAVTTEPDSSSYNIEFTFDSDVTCNITVMYFAKEEMVNGCVVYTPRDGNMNSETYTYKKGANQTFSQSSHLITPSKFPEDEWGFDFDKEEIPIVIHCTVEKEPEHAGHSHVTFCALEKLNEGYSIKVIKQKQCVDGLLYILQEFYGIENKEIDPSKLGDDEDEEEDNTAECVICMSEMRDTLILPCRHLCLCKTCADSLRYQASNCPICRAPFRALLQMRAIRKKVAKPENTETTNHASDDEDEFGVSQKDVPAGYEAISLIEALNGPCFYNTKSAEPRQRLSSSQSSVRRSKKKKKDGKGSTLLRDKDKDVIADEERERGTIQTPQVETETTAETKNEEVQDEVESQAQEASEEPAGEEKTTQSLASGTKAKKVKKQISSSSEKSLDIPDQPENTTEEGAIEELPRIASSCASDEDDTFALSSRTQTTTLPGTPDYVLDEEISDTEEKLE